MPSVIFTENSKNRKIGDVATTYVSQATCPITCKLFNNGCYAEKGLTGIHTRRLNNSDEKDYIEIAKLEASLIKAAKGDKPLRIHIVGDCKDDESAAIISEAASHYITKYNQPIWAYTHGKSKRESWGKINILKSVHSPEEADQAYKEGFVSALVVDKFEKDTTYKISENLSGIPCPQQTNKVNNCKECKLCMNTDKLYNKKRIILFQKH